MPKITYIEFDGTTHELEVPVGYSVMEGGVQNGVEGIVAECGGQCSCATCHVYVDPEWFDKTGEQSEVEKDMLDMAASEVGETSRLSCQIQVTTDLDGLIVRTPEAQV